MNTLNKNYDPACSMNATVASLRTLLSQAIDAMKSQSYGCAITRLRVAFDAIRFMSVADDEKEDIHTNDGQISDQPPSFEFSSLFYSFDANQRLLSDYNAYALYDQAIGISAAEPNSTEFESRALSSDANLARLSTIILYNIGLCHQLKGLRNSTGAQDRNLKKALRFYRIALETLDSCVSCRRAIDNFLRLALVNNLGHIHSMALDNDATLQCFGYLRRVLAAQVESNEVERDCYCVFRINILLSQGGHYNVLAAAA
jgi:hypothetical protein